MKQTRRIPITFVLAALSVGSACSATATSSPDGATTSLETARQAPSPSLPTPPEPPATSEHATPATPTTSEPDVDEEAAVTTDAAIRIESVADTAPEPDPGALTEVTLDQGPTRLDMTDVAIPAGPCGDIEPIPESATSASAIVVDAIGDGSEDDVVTSYLDGADWTIRLMTATAVVSEYPVSAVGPGYVEVLGAVQLDGEPGDQFLAVVGSSASAVRVGAFGVDESGCIVRFGNGGGVEAEFQVGGTIGGLHGLACGTWEGAGYLEELSGVPVDGDTYNVYGTTMHKVGVDELEGASGTHIFGQSFDDVQFVADIDCPGIGL